jgi:hypothetical protein
MEKAEGPRVTFRPSGGARPSAGTGGGTPVAGWAATIAYNCGHERIWPPYKAQAEIWRAIGRRPCPDCRQPWSPPEPGTVYRLALAVGGVPLTAWRWPCLDLCWHHSAEATAKGVEIPKGIECRVGCIVPTRNTDLMLCDVCEGNVAIVPTPEPKRP